LRCPSKIGSAEFHARRGSEKKRYKGASIDVLLEDRTVRNPGSFFAYAGYDRPHKFYGSSEFIELEQKFSFMRLLDVSKCFASIYSHTLAWAVKSVQHGKENVSAISFANEFDGLMLFSNYNETNGIPVGAEVSRIFAEIILQSADVRLLRGAAKHRLVLNRDFATRRYVDDYRMFAHSPEALDLLEATLVEALGIFNLHLNDSKSFTFSRPFQTKESRMIAAVGKGVAVYKDHLSTYEAKTNRRLPRAIRSTHNLLKSFINDMKATCLEPGLGYGGLSNYVIATIVQTIEDLIESFRPGESRRNPSLRANYLGAFETLLRTVYYFFAVNVTVDASYKVAKVTILSLRFFLKYLPEFRIGLYEVISELISEVIANPTLHNVSLSNCVPVEVMNIVLASSELPNAYRANLQDIRRRVLTEDRVDYFSYISLIFFYGYTDAKFLAGVEKRLTLRFLDGASPRRNSHDAHFMLDLIGCPYLTNAFRMKVVNSLYHCLELPPGPTLTRQALLAEVEANPWFVNWKQIDLLNHLRKKELSAVY
jgi:hypothetical protein